MRKYFKAIHKWLSIPVGLILSITCLTGAILVFQDEILEWKYPDRYFVQEVKDKPIPLPELVSIINAKLDTNSVTSVRISHEPRRAYAMGLEKGFRTTLYVDQYTGEIQGLYEFRESSFFTVMQIHRWLMDGSRTFGKYAVGISTLIFVFIIISGVIIWFPKKKKHLKSGLRIKFKSGRKRLFLDLHRALGIYATLILFICSLTGLMWSFDWYRNGVFKIFGAEVPKEQGHGKRGGGNKEKEPMNIAHWQVVADGLRKENPNYDYIRVADKSATVHLRNAPTSRASDDYKFDSTTGQITETILYKDQPKISKIWGWAYALHVGNYWGVWSKILTFLASMIGATLPITGYYLLFVKKKKKKHRKESKFKKQLAH